MSVRRVETGVQFVHTQDPAQLIFIQVLEYYVQLKRNMLFLFDSLALATPDNGGCVFNLKVFNVRKRPY